MIILVKINSVLTIKLRSVAQTQYPDLVSSTMICEFANPNIKMPC